MSVDLFIALSRPKDGMPPGCMRAIIKDYYHDLALLELRCQQRGGKWRIHKTVNARDTERAYKVLLHDLIEHPEFHAKIESRWKTALLQPCCVAGDKKFMLDVDTKDPESLYAVKLCLGDNLIQTVETENGYHLIIKSCDTRKVTALTMTNAEGKIVPIATLQRDGYVFVKTYQSL